MNLIQIKQIEGLAAYIQENVPAVMEGYHVVYQTGDQTISGAKTFTGPVLITGDANISGTFTSSGVSYFDNNVYISGELWITGSDGSPIQITGNGSAGGGGGGDPINKNYLVYTTGDQFITGGKQFLSRITGHKGFYITGDHSLNNAYLENTFLQIDTGPNNNRGLQVSKGTENTPSLSIYNYEGTEGTTPAEMMSGSALLYAGNTHTKHLTITNATKSGDIRFFTIGDRDDYLSDFDWYDPASQRLIIASGGNVGIGVTGIHQGTALSVNPLERLHVSGGNFRVDGNSYVSGELWITGTGGYPIQITGNGGGGGGSIGDYITALGISGYNLSGNTLWVGDGGAHISGDSAIDGDLTLLGTFYLTGGATVGEADGDNVFLVGTTAGGLPRIGMGEFPDVDSIEELVHISGGNLYVESGQIISQIGQNDTLNAVFKKDYAGAPEPKSSLSIYNYDSAEAGIASDLGVGPMLYAKGHHLTVTNVTETGDIRFFTLGSEFGSAGDWYDPAQQRLIIHSGGNVGIGVTGLDPTNPDLSVAPLEKLHVSGGNFRVDGNFIGTGESSRPTVQGSGVMLQGEEFPGVSYIGASSYTITEDARNKVLHFRPFLSDISVELPTSDAFKNFKFTARVTGAQNNFVGFAPDNSSYSIYGEGSGLRAQHAWATIYRGDTEDWFIYGDPLVNAGPAPTTPTPTTPTPTTPTPTTPTPTTPTPTTPTPTTPTPTTPTPTTTPEPSPDLLKDGLMMRFFAWDDPDSARASSFSSSESVNINGAVKSRSVLYPSYKSPLLPQLTGAFSDNTTYSTWDEAAVGSTDTHGTAKSGVYLKDGASMILPQFQLNSAGGQWDSFNGAMDFLTGITDGWTITYWSKPDWPTSSYNPSPEDIDYQWYNIGYPNDHRSAGYFYKFQSTDVEGIIRGDASNFVYAGTSQNQPPDPILQGTGEVWTFNVLSYGGGQIGGAALGGSSYDANNVLWAAGTGAVDEINLKLFSGDASSVPAGFDHGLRIRGASLAALGVTEGWVDVTQQNSFTFGSGFGSANTQPITGYISDFRVYSGTLSTGQIRDIYTGEGLV